MSRRRAVVAGAVALIAVIAGALLVGVPQWAARRQAATLAAGTQAVVPPPQGRKIKARLFYVADDGMRLTGVEREVPYGEGTVEQAREILAAQVAPVAAPLVSAVPPGTAIRTVFITDDGSAYVDLSHQVAAGHGGGTLDELLTVYTLVNALTTNLPAVTAVQVLVDGKEVDTLAGHVDLRRPLAGNLAWVQ
jgi:germination protein M